MQVRSPQNGDQPLKLTIIGAGTAGRQLAGQAIAAGHNVTLEDVLPSKLRSALAEIDIVGRTGRLYLSETIADAVRDADMVIDFVPDELESKLEIVSMVDRMAPPRTVLCIPTQALSVTDLASCTYRADRCTGFQAEGQNLKLIRAEQTSDATVMQCEHFWESLGYRVATVQEDPSTHS